MEKPQEVKEEKKHSKKLYNPIPESELHSENPLVKAAKKWDKIVQTIAGKTGHLISVLGNRQITIDRDGIIMLFDKNTEAASKAIADTHKNVIEEGFIKASGVNCRVKTAFLEDIEDVLVDYWSLKPPGGQEEDIKESVSYENKDPLESLMERVPEIIESADDTAF